MKLRHYILVGLAFILLFLPSVLLYFVVATESGLRFAAYHLGKLGPVTVTVTGASGTLIGGFRLEALHIQHRRVDLDLHAISGRLSFTPLLVQRVDVPEIGIGSAVIRLFRDPNPDTHWKAHFLPSMLQIDGDSVSVASGRLIAVNGRAFDFTAAHGSVSVYPKQLRIRDAGLQQADLHFTANGRVLAAQPIGLEGKVDTTYQPSRLPAWHFISTLKGDLESLPIRTQIDRPFHAEVDGAARTLTSSWNYTGKATVLDFDIVPFGGGNVLGLISGKLDVTADADGYTAHGALTPAGLDTGALGVDFNGAYADRRLQIRQATVRHAASNAVATTRGQVLITDQGPQLALEGDWHDFRWPLPAKQPAMKSPQGHYTLKGGKPWQVELRGDVLVDQLPVMPATLSGELNTDALRIDAATVEILKGKAEFTGETRWRPAQSWRIAGRAADVDPSALRADLPGKVSFSFKADGAPFAADGALNLAIDSLAGRLRGQTASGKGQFTRLAHSDDWHFKDVNLQLGHTQLQLNGGLGARRDLQFAINADDLSLLDSEARGKISASGRYAGTDAEPVLVFKGKGTGFEWRGRKLASLDADVDIDMSPQGHMQGRVNLTDLKFGNRTLQSTSVQMSGTNSVHTIIVDMNAAPLRVSLTAQGAWQDGLWRGSVQTLGIEDGARLKLAQEGSVPLQFNLQKLHLDKLCLKGSEERVCASGERDGNAWQTAFSAESLPLRALTAGLSQDMDYDGTIDLQGEAAATPAMLITGSVHAQLRDAVLHHHLSNAREEKMALGTGKVDAKASAGDFSLVVGLEAGASGHIHGELTGQRSTAAWQDYPIKGRLEASTDALNVLDIYVGGIDRAVGRITTDVSIGGTLGQPAVEGQVQLRDAQIDVYQVNLSLKDLSMDAKFDATALDLSGQSRLGQGTAKFSGKLAWRDRQPYGSLHVEGENLRVVDVPEARIDASPKLDFKLAGRRIDATGEVRIPYAHLLPKDLTNAVLASSDEVLVGAPPVDPKERWVVVSDIKLSLGDRVDIDTFGLSAKLGGSLEVRTDESQISRGQGELNVSEGKYLAFGRKLDIERGRLIFNSSSPLADPGIDLRAQKVFPDITAGVNVRGTLRAPRMTFFSEPAIPQSQIVSLILAGGSLESVQNSDRPGAARNDLVAQGGAILAQRLGSKVGIEDVSLESDLTNETSLVLGKYLSPWLYVSYGISLAEAINTLKLRITLGKGWTLKTESGKAKSADVVYTIQKK